MSQQCWDMRGILAAARYRNAESLEYMALYDLIGPEALETPGYAAASGWGGWASYIQNWSREVVTRPHRDAPVGRDVVVTRSDRWWTFGWDHHYFEIADSLSSTIAVSASGEACTEWDRHSCYPDGAMEVLASSGWAALPVPRRYGAKEAGARDLAVVHLTLARRSLAVAQAYYFVVGARSRGDREIGLGTPAKSMAAQASEGSSTARLRPNRACVDLRCVATNDQGPHV
jgi:hypothetical protein